MSVLPPIVLGMTHTIVLPLPPTVSSQFVVLAPDHLPSDLQTVLRRWASRVRDPSTALDGLRDSTVSIALIDNVPLGDAESLVRAGNPPHLVRRVWAADRHLLVACNGPPALSIVPAVMSFGIANALAVASGGLVFDPLTGEITAPDQIAADEEVILTGPPAIPVGAWVPFCEDDGRLRTHGMTRFGLPDLSTQEVPCDVVPDWGYVLAATGSVLIRHSWEELSADPRRTFLEMPNPLMVCDHHVHAEARATELLEDLDRPHRATPVGLRLDFEICDTQHPGGDDSTLELCRPDGFTGAHEQWLRHTTGFLLEGVRR
jgi:hypothetical protein